jgi:hypothetical protein
MTKVQFKLNWSKKEKDWLFHYPDDAGRSCMGLFFEMLKIEDNISFIMNEFKNGALKKKAKPQTLKEFLTERGYDYKTLKITCDKFKDTKENDA